VKRPAISDPRRWREILPAPSDDADRGDARDPEAKIGAAIRAAAEAPAWDDLRIAHLRQDVLRAAAVERRPVRPARTFRRPTWALAAGCLLLGAAATALASYALERFQRTAAPAATGGAVAPAPPRRHASSSRAHREAPPVVEAAPVPSLEAPPVAVAPPPLRLAVRPTGAARPRAPRLSAPPPEAATPSSEAAELADAIRALRERSDAPDALSRLDDYQRRYPAGTLAREAALARVEALLALGRDTVALEVLDRLALDDSAVDRPVALARAELRAAAGRCADAVGDFARVRGGAGDDAVAARALYGQAICHLHAGDRRAARAAFELYLRRFPDSPLRADVARALAGLGS
jgi:TolA-binding protein